MTRKELEVEGWEYKCDYDTGRVIMQRSRTAIIFNSRKNDVDGYANIREGENAMSAMIRSSFAHERDFRPEAYYCKECGELFGCCFGRYRACEFCVMKNLCMVNRDTEKKRIDHCEACIKRGIKDNDENRRC